MSNIWTFLGIYNKILIVITVTSKCTLFWLADTHHSLCALPILCNARCYINPNVTDVWDSVFKGPAIQRMTTTSHYSGWPPCKYPILQKDLWGSNIIWKERINRPLHHHNICNNTKSFLKISQHAAGDGHSHLARHRGRWGPEIGVIKSRLRHPGT